MIQPLLVEEVAHKAVRQVIEEVAVALQAELISTFHASLHHPCRFSSSSGISGKGRPTFEKLPHRCQHEAGFAASVK
jgi:hypothetical protein